MGRTTAYMSPSPQLCFFFLRRVGFDCWSVAWFAWCSVVSFWGRVSVCHPDWFGTCCVDSGWPWTQRLLGSIHSRGRITGVCPHVQIFLCYAVYTPAKHPVLFRVWTSANLTSLPPVGLCSQTGRAGPAAKKTEIWRIENLAFRCECACLGCRQHPGMQTAVGLFSSGIYHLSPLRSPCCIIAHIYTQSINFSLF